jgi:hypothetical protein
MKCAIVDDLLKQFECDVLRYQHTQKHVIRQWKMEKITAIADNHTFCCLLFHIFALSIDRMRIEKNTRKFVCVSVLKSRNQKGMMTNYCFPMIRYMRICV